MGYYRCLYDKDGNYLGNYFTDQTNDTKQRTNLTQYEFLGEYSPAEMNEINLSKNKKWRTFRNNIKK